MAYHLGIYRRDRSVDYLQLMLDQHKTVDMKASNRRIAPYGYIHPNDTLLLKESSGPVWGKCQIPWVTDYDFRGTNENMLDVLMSIWEPLGLRNEEHAFRVYEKVGANRYLTVFGLADAVQFDSPVYIEKHDRRVWVPDYILPPQLEAVLSTRDWKNEITLR